MSQVYKKIRNILINVSNYSKNCKHLLPRNAPAYAIQGRAGGR